MVEIKLNGETVSVEPQNGESLLHALRESCGMRSLKNGCEPQGQCGCCLALVNGKPKVTCAIPAKKCDGREVVTLEGVPAEERDLYARAFEAAAGLQCGFCIPGIVLRAKALIDDNPTPSREEIAKAIDVNLCRCTGYVKVIDAVELMAKARAGEEIPAPCDDGRVGKPLRRYTAADMTLGDRPYVDDLVREGMLHGAVLQSPHPRARVRAIDTSKAEALPGVVRVATAADVPGERWYGLIYRDWPGFVAIGEETRCVGDVIAAVAAESDLIAREALALIEVDFEVLEPVLTPDAALAEGAPTVNPNRPDNRLSTSVIRRGEAEAQLAKSAHVVEGTFQTQRIEHLFLEPESAMAEPLPDGRLYLATQGQGIFDDRRQVAAFLGIPEEQLFVELYPSGGAFGGKEDMSIQAHTALLAHLTGKPVKITLTREQSIRMHPKRHPIRMHYRIGCDAEGKLTGVWARMVGDTGAYASVGGKVLERAAGHACGPYKVDHVDIEAIAAHTNNPPCGAMRGFGANQAHFGVESLLDELADKAGLDAWEFRYRNALELGDTYSTGQILDKAVGIKATLEAIKPHYDAAKQSGAAVGLACGLKNTGLGNGAKEWGKCRLVVEEDGTISLYNGYTEMGQGLLTVLIQFAVEATGLPASVFRPKVDATYQLAVGQTTGSRGTLFGGNSVLAASKALKADLDAGKTLGDLVGQVYKGDVLIDDTTPLGAPVERIKTHTSFGYASQLCVLDEEGKLARFVAAHDVGRAVNPDLCAGQIEGSIHMGLGFALTEELPCVNGMPLSFKLRDIGVLRARDMPEVEVILVEEHEPEGPCGAKGVGEIGLVPTAGAVGNALKRFDGERRFRLPMKESPAAQAISVGRIRSKIPREEWS
ncbi:MAG TPA: selenium-dependent xanthine dehydrogenase [Planctomycetes bacterium]|nr:selenium-dependent xanthine dehydrogenase [Planctomycetota bacterium]